MDLSEQCECCERAAVEGVVHPDEGTFICYRCAYELVAAEVATLRNGRGAVDDPVLAAVARMRMWAAANGQADTQGLMDDEWEALARAALRETP